MITDSQTNKLFLADCLSEFQPKFFPLFKKVLNECNIPFEFLPNTKDIWAVDYMPIQIAKDKFVQFKYKPDYLQTKKLPETISDVDSICKAINYSTIKSTIILDGGNVVRYKDKVIMCDKVFHENKNTTEKDLIKQLRELFEVDSLFFVPWDEDDYTGHADGMVRFIDEKNVLINNPLKGKDEFETSFRMSLHNAGFDWIELPYYPPNDPTLTSAEGLYINYLQMEQAIIMPTFNSKYDEAAVGILEDAFRGQTIKIVYSDELAIEGGILNCITWNVKQFNPSYP